MKDTAADTRTVEQIEAEIKKLADEREEKLETTKAENLDTVKKLCKQHGFTATNLRSCLATKGKKKASDDGSITPTRGFQRQRTDEKKPTVLRVGFLFMLSC